MQATAGDYYQRLAAEGTPYVRWEIAPGTAHGVPASAAGRAAIKAALLQTWPVTTSLSRDGDDITIQWSSNAARQYQLQWKQALTDAEWTDLGAPVTANASTTSTTVSTGGAEQGFYRVRLLP